MAIGPTLWRAASLATDLDGFLGRVGAAILHDLGADTLVVRIVDQEQSHLDTIAAIHGGAVGVTHPAHPRSELSAPALARITTWIENGHAERAGTSGVARDLMRGVGDVAIGEWSIVPLAANSEALGALLIGSATHVEPRRLAAISEPIAAMLATEQTRRQLTQLREAAEADKAAALARLQMRDIEVAIVGADSGLRDVMRQVEQVAPSNAPVLILGETGSGKEVVARAIHDRSGHGQGPILRVNCGAIAPELVDSELFGHERGSFTGAAQQRRGWFERADGGTLFLDEIGELPLAAQVRLLRVVQDGVFERVGGARPLKVDVRLVTATHRDLGAMVRAGEFREDLWYRINVFMIRLPPLRERQDDISALADHFAERAGRRFGKTGLQITPEDLALLRAYPWPGNVRELQAVIERATILGEGRRLDVERAIGRSESAAPITASRGEFPTLDEAMRAHIERALARCGGKIDGKAGAAKLLALHPNTLRSRMQKLGVSWERFRS